MKEISEEWLSSQVGNVTNSGLILVLKRNKNPFSSSNRPQLIQRITKQINDGSLDLNAFLLEVRLIEECSSKVIYLLDLVDNSVLRNAETLASEITANFGRPRSKGLETINHPDEPVLNYAQITSDEIRIKVSETQLQVIPDYTTIDYETGTMGYSRTPHTNVIVFSVDRKTGRSIVYLDSPWNIHSHRGFRGTATEKEYFKHYLEKFEAIFGKAEALNVTDKIRGIYRSKKRIAIPRKLNDITPANTKRQLTNENLLDEETCIASLQNADGGIIEKNSLTFLSDSSNGVLLNDIHVNIDVLEGRLSIAAERLSSEVDYVISAVR